MSTFTQPELDAIVNFLSSGAKYSKDIQKQMHMSSEKLNACLVALTEQHKVETYIADGHRWSLKRSIEVRKAEIKVRDTLLKFEGMSFETLLKKTDLLSGILKEALDYLKKEGRVVYVKELGGYKQP